MADLSRRMVYILILILLVIQAAVIVPTAAAQETMIQITRYSVSSDMIASGDQFTVDMTVKNISDEQITGLHVKVQESSDWSVVAIEPNAEISTSLDCGASTSFSITMVYNGGGDGQIPVSFSYIKGVNEQIIEERYLLINLEDVDGTVPDRYLPILTITNNKTLSASAGSQLTAEIDIQNISSYAAEEVLVIVSVEDAPLSFPAEKMFYLGSLESGETETVNLSIQTEETADEGSYIIKINYRFTNYLGQICEAYENLYMQIGEEKALVLLPHLDEEAVVVPGEEFKLLISAENHGQLVIRDININLEGLSSTEIHMVSDNNPQYIDDLEVGMGTEITYVITAAPGMPDDSYPIILKADYTDETGTVHRMEQEILLKVSSKPVTGTDDVKPSPDAGSTSVQQSGRLEVGNIRFTGNLKPGNVVDVHCTYYNTGGSTLRNLIIKIEGNFEVKDETVFVGDMEKDSSGYYHGTFKAMKPGEIAGRLIFSFQDLSGQPLVLTEPFTMNIEEQTNSSTSQDTPADSNRFSLWYLVIPTLVAGAAVTGLQTKRKNHLEEQEPVDE